MNINNFEFITHTLNQEDELPEIHESLGDLTEVLEGRNYSLYDEMASDTFVFNLSKTNYGTFKYSGVSDSKNIEGILYDNGNNSFVLSSVTTKTTPAEFFTHLDNSIEKLVDPNKTYDKKVIKIEEEGHITLEIEELLDNGIVIAERIINYKDHSFGRDNDSMDRKVYLVLSDFGLGGVEIIYDTNGNVLDIETIGISQLSGTTFDKEELMRMIKMAKFDLLSREVFRIKNVLNGQRSLKA